MDALKASTKAFVSLLNLPPHNFAILFQFPLFHEGPNRQRQAKKGDKALGIGLIIYIVFAEGDIFLAVKGIRARRAGRNDIAFIELQTDRTGHRFLRFIDKGLEGFPQLGEPHAVIDKFCITNANLFLIIVGGPIKANISSSLWA